MRNGTVGNKFANFVTLFVLLACSVSIKSIYGQEDAQYIRFIRGEQQWQGELQTAIASFKNDAGVQLNLVAAVHLGESEYYRQLNDFFATQDVVLYELIAEADQIPSINNASNNKSLIGFLQQSLADFLNLSFQLNDIDYGRPNFLHADLTPRQLSAIMQSKNENFYTMFLNLLKAQMVKRNADAEQSLTSISVLSMLGALNAENQQDAFKYLFAEELGSNGGVIVGAELEQQLTLLGDRNKAALAVLTDVLENPDARQISIFYGAAHMPGIAREISATMGFQPVARHWQSAWIIPSPLN
jgi:hypothetical protein